MSVKNRKSAAAGVADAGHLLPAGPKPATVVGLLLVSIILLTLAFAPIYQFYLAWIGLVPWMIVVARARRMRSAFLWSWLGGTSFFVANMWWLGNVTVPGMIALLVYLGVYWGVAAMAIRGAGIFDPRPTWPIGTAESTIAWGILGALAGGGQGWTTAASVGTWFAVPFAVPLGILLGAAGGAVGGLLVGAIAWALIAGASALLRRLGLWVESGYRPFIRAALLTATIWTGLEWVRGNLFTGLPWLYLGHTQTPILPMCQIADVLGVYGASFWVVLVNAVVALWLLNGRRWRMMVPAAGVTVSIVLLTLGYGLYRMNQKTLSPGPRVVVVQPNYPQAVTGEKSAMPAERLGLHEEQTRRALAHNPADLVVWSETIMPPLNEDGRRQLRELAEKQSDDRVRREVGREAADAEEAHHRLSSLSRSLQVSILTGSTFYLWKPEAGKWVLDRRNSAFLYDESGQLQYARYDKIHMVPFGEFIPFKNDLPWLYDALLKLTPYEYDYTLTPGDEDRLTVFSFDARGKSWRFVTPICFEDIDSCIVARMLRPDGGSGQKRADMIVNITNDGWFKANENAQHLQAAIFRSIENRVPTARSVNTGISGFIDSCGRTSNLIEARTTGTAEIELKLDSRLSFYTRFGDIFAIVCVALTGGVLASAAVRGWANRRRTGQLAQRR